MIGIEYSPKPGPELAVYEGLWKVASPSGADLSGKEAVEFFRKSGVDSGFLKQIWGLSTPSATMSHVQFVTALRFITMVQNGDFPLTKERLLSCADTNYGPANNFPKFASIQLNLPAAAPANPVTPSRPITTPATTAGVVPVTPETAVYAMTPEDHLKYFNLFKGYDINGDGFLSGSEAVAVFAQSGLDQMVLRAIWELADQDRDNQLNSKEFSVAFHLIICISKKKLALPVTLPPPLLNFLKNAPLIPGVPHAAVPTAAAAVVGVPTAAVVAPSQHQQQTRLQPLAINIPEPAMTVNPAAVHMKTPPLTPGAAARPDSSRLMTVTDSDEEQLTNSVTNIRDISRRALQAGDIAVEANISSSNQLKTVLQRLAQEKIALTSAVSSAENSAIESSNKLSSIVEEITVLESELSELRRQLDDTRSTSMNTQGQLSERTMEKQNLLNKITETRAAIAQQSNDLSVLAVDVGKSEGQRAELDEKEQSLNSDIMNIKTDVNNINNELVALQSILMALNGDMDARGAELSRLQAQKNASQNALTRQRGSIEKQEQELDELKKEKQSLEHTRADMIQKVSHSVSAAGATASASFDSHDGIASVYPVTEEVVTSTSPLRAKADTSFAAFDTTDQTAVPAAATAAAVTGSSGSTSPVKTAGTSSLTVDTSSTTSSSNAAAVAGAGGIAGMESAPTPSKSSSPALSLSPPKSAAAATLPRTNSSLRNSKTQSSVSTPTAATAAAASTTATPAVPKPLEKKASAHSLLKRSKGSGNNSSTNKILIRTHSMNNKNGEVDPFDDFGATSIGGVASATTSAGGSPRSPRSPSTIGGEDVVPFDVDFNMPESANLHTTATAAGGGEATDHTTHPSYTSSADEGFGFDKNPFDEDLTAATSGRNEGESTSRSVHFTASTKAPADDGFGDPDDGFGSVSDGFGSSSGGTSDGFDKNPFDDPIAFDAFSSSSSSGASAGFGASPFDAFGSDFAAAPAASSSSGKTPVSGFDDW